MTAEERRKRVILLVLRGFTFAEAEAMVAIGQGSVYI